MIVFSIITRLITVKKLWSVPLLVVFAAIFVLTSNN